MGEAQLTHCSFLLFAHSFDVGVGAASDNGGSPT